MFSFPTKPYMAWRQAVLNSKRRPEKYDDKTWEKKWNEIIRKNQMAFLKFWTIFIDERQDIGRYGMHPAEDCFNYLCLFHLNNFARVIQLYQRARFAEFVSAVAGAENRVRIFDIGAGTGVASQALLHELTRVNPKIVERTKVTLVDKRKAALESAADMIKSQWPDVLLTNVKEDVRDFVPRPTNDSTLTIGLFSYVANELFTTSSRFSEAKLVALFHQYDIIVVLDSAEEKQAKSFMTLRNTMVEKGWNCFFPCPHQLGCPLIKKAEEAEAEEEIDSSASAIDTRTMIRDRCFSEFEDVDLFELRSIAKTLKLERTHLAASAYIFCSPRLTQKINAATPPVPQRKLRPVVVGKPIVETDDGIFIKLMLCEPEGMITEELIRKNSREFIYRGRDY